MSPDGFHMRGHRYIEIFVSFSTNTMTVPPFFIRSLPCHKRPSGMSKWKPRSNHPRLNRISHRLNKNQKTLYAVVSILLLIPLSIGMPRASPFLFAKDNVSASHEKVYPDSKQFRRSKAPTTLSPTANLEKTGTENVKGFSTSDSGKLHSPGNSRTAGPPSYLPLAQHLKNVNYSRSISLRDMVYGAQKRTYPDLEPTNNLDLLNCARCSRYSKALGLQIPHSDHLLQLARLVLRLAIFYDFSSMLLLPCSDEFHWILPLKDAIRRYNPEFKTYCAVTDVKTVVDLITKYNRRVLTGVDFVVYEPLVHGTLPEVDAMLTWRGLEQYDLEVIQKVFKDAVRTKIKHVLIGNSPGHENVKVVETGPRTFSITRRGIPGLNVRAYPFGFNSAMRVFPFVGKQLLMYNTSGMRDGW